MQDQLCLSLGVKFDSLDPPMGAQSFIVAKTSMQQQKTLSL
jgi:hypothetical protein